MKPDWEAIVYIIGIIAICTGLVQCHEQAQQTRRQKEQIEFDREKFQAEMKVKMTEIHLQNKTRGTNEQKTTP